MKPLQAIGWLGVSLCLAAPSAFSREPVGRPAAARVPAPSAEEVNLDRFLSIYEDLAAALSNVDDMTDANMVAARVAVDFLLLHGTGKALVDDVMTSGDSKRVSPEFMRSFNTRKEHARITVENAITHLRKVECYGSDALPAALSFSGLMSGNMQNPQAGAVWELLANNREMMSFLLDKVVDAESAALVAGLLQSAYNYETALETYSLQLDVESMTASQNEDYELRRSLADARILIRERDLDKVDFYGCQALRECVDAIIGK